MQARLWAHLGDSWHNQVFYEFSPDRKQEHPQRILGAFRGKIHADAYSGYNVLFQDGTRTAIGCWAHSRRRYWEARDSDPERAAVAMGFIRQLYAVEVQSKSLDPAQRLEIRKATSAPLVADYKAWLNVEVMKVLPKSQMGEAMRYALGQWTALNQFLNDGEVPLDTNAIERLLRGVAISRN